MTEPRIAHNTTQTAEVAYKPVENTLGITTVQYDDVPIDMYRFFDVPMDMADKKTKGELRDISSWAFYDMDTLGDGLQKLRSLEIRLGVPSGGERRHSKVWNWVQMEKQIVDMQKRQEALSG